MFDPVSQSWRVFGRIVFWIVFCLTVVAARGAWTPPAGLENHEHPVQTWTQNHILFGDGFRRHLAPPERLLASILGVILGSILDPRAHQAIFTKNGTALQREHDF